MAKSFFTSFCISRTRFQQPGTQWCRATSPRRCGLRYGTTVPREVSIAGVDFFGIGHFNHGSTSQEAFKIAVKCPNWPNFPRLRRAEKGFARVGLPKSRQSVTLSLTVRSPNTITPVSWRVGALEPWGLEAAVQSNLEIFILALTCSGARFFYLGGSATCETPGAAATPTGCLFAERF